MSSNDNEIFKSVVLTASQLVKVQQAGELGGIFVSSGSPTITVYDGQDATGLVLVSAFTATAATPYPLPVQFKTGLYIDVSGTGSMTVMYN